MEEKRHCPFCDEIIKANARKCRHCGEWLTGKDATQKLEFTDSFTLMRNRLASKYEIMETVGKGGMAIVYKAKHKKLDRIVALKVLHTNLVHDTEFVDRFKREAQLSASLSHPNIISLYDVDQTDDFHCLAMEFLEGQDLHSVIKEKGRLSLEETLSIIVPIAEALDHAHAKGIIHRDIKSSNIIFTDAGKPVLTDFGIAHAASSSKLTQTGTIIGTPEYMSPEQARGKEVDGRSDFYSLGIVMYECLTGRVPFQGDSPLSVIHKIVHEPASPLSGERDDIPLYIHRIVDRLIAKDPDERVSSGKELQGMLKQKKVSDITKPKERSAQAARISEPAPEPASGEKADRPRRLAYKPFDIAWLILTGIAFYALGEFYFRPDPIIIGIATICLIIGAISYPGPVYGFIFGAFISITYFLPWLFSGAGEYVEINMLLIVTSFASIAGLILYSFAALLRLIRSIRTRLIIILVCLLLIITGLIGYQLAFTTETIRISSDPEGAEVFLNSEYKGTTPYRLKLRNTKKEYSLRLEKNGYFPLDTTIRFSRDSKNITFSLPARAIVVTINSIPQGAHVYKNQEYLGLTPQKISIDKGSGNYCVLTLKKEDYFDNYPTILYKHILGDTTLTFQLNPRKRGVLEDERYNQSYDWVRIGDQIWMAENLNRPVYGSSCYDNSDQYCSDYGRLYTWEAARKACPNGWHLASDEDWKELESFLGMDDAELNSTGDRGTDQGKKLKADEGWNDAGYATYERNFSALPAGFWYDSEFCCEGRSTVFWTSTNISQSTNAWIRQLDIGGDKIRRVTIDYTSGNRFSVRCVKDNINSSN